MQIHFYKYQGAGNDFVVLDNREGIYDGLSTAQIHFLCDRRFGIGADGLMMLNPHTEGDFEMRYFNADGREGSMCGNGGRCLVAFARHRELIGTSTRFYAVDGWHEAHIQDDGWVSLKMQDVGEVERSGDDFVLDTGSPHYVRFVPDVDAVDVWRSGRDIRYNERFSGEGINVNFVQRTDGGLKIRTYERGVEAETLACGTGVTAAAIAAAGDQPGSHAVAVNARGGRLEVRYRQTDEQHFTDVWLCGPAAYVFEGNIPVE
ncbi:diaminopimelate epimerase [Compostibacter hankyongensis]|uniref:Diaminopimelate epimerase n=1 Tax=Compostibacter hankyongensis TaxID=1007089 RepID=A0ABP8FPG6_9BACT